ALAQAWRLLGELGAVDAQGRITDAGRALRSLPLPPRLARMVLDAARHGGAELAASIAVVLTEPALGGKDGDLRHRLDEFRRDRSHRAQDARAMAKRWAQIAAAQKVGSEKRAVSAGESSVGSLLALAYPGRIAKNRGAQGGFLLANGRGAAIDPASALWRGAFPPGARITRRGALAPPRLAAPLLPAGAAAPLFVRLRRRGDTRF